MKNLLFILGLVLCFAACQKADDFLDPKTTGLTEEAVFTDSIRTMAFLSRIYSDVGYSFTRGRWDSHGNTDAATDDAEYRYSGTGQKAVILYNGTVSPTNFPFPEFWTTPYTNIRRVNLLLAKLPETPLSPALRIRVAAEARFLRAWYYHWLLATFGGVPIVGDKVYTISDFINEPRTSYAECVDYLVKELDAAAADLPRKADYAEQDYGRITKGACLALKSRVLLYAASPLFNGSSEAKNPDQARIVSYPTFDVAHWQKAAAAAEALINSGEYSLVKDNTTAPGAGFVQVFLDRVNPEYIFFQNRGANRDIEGFYNMPTRGGAWNHMPTHNLAAAFPMKNGKAITDPESGYNATNPYVNRDPRFDNTIIFNEAKYFLQSSNSLQPVYTYENAPSDGFTSAGQTTGYYSRKMCNPNIAANSSANTQRGWPLIRYAEILLNYAEAINEAGQTNLAYDKLKELRDRAGIEPGADNLYGMTPSMTQAEMRAFVQNERRIELAFEDHRWNDIRRWKIAMEVNNGYNKRMRIVKTGSTYTYEIVNSIRQHNFRPEMYLLPLPDGEVLKAPAMLQNPGW